MTTSVTTSSAAYSAYFTSLAAENNASQESLHVDEESEYSNQTQLIHNKTALKKQAVLAQQKQAVTQNTDVAQDNAQLASTDEASVKALKIARQHLEFALEAANKRLDNPEAAMSNLPELRLPEDVDGDESKAMTLYMETLDVKSGLVEEGTLDTWMGMLNQLLREIQEGAITLARAMAAVANLAVKIAMEMTRMSADATRQGGVDMFNAAVTGCIAMMGMAVGGAAIQIKSTHKINGEEKATLTNKTDIHKVLQKSETDIAANKNKIVQDTNMSPTDKASLEKDIQKLRKTIKEKEPELAEKDRELKNAEHKHRMEMVVGSSMTAIAIPGSALFSAMGEKERADKQADAAMAEGMAKVWNDLFSNLKDFVAKLVEMIEMIKNARDQVYANNTK